MWKYFNETEDINLTYAIIQNVGLGTHIYADGTVRHNEVITHSNGYAKLNGQYIGNYPYTYQSSESAYPPSISFYPGYYQYPSNTQQSYYQYQYPSYQQQYNYQYQYPTYQQQNYGYSQYQYPAYQQQSSG